MLPRFECAPIMVASLTLHTATSCSQRDPLLRELILHVTQRGALDRRVPEQTRLIGVLLDLIAAMPDVPLQLPTPRDERAQKLMTLIATEPGASVAELAPRAGASLRTIERCFVEDTGMSVGEWRRRFRLLEALRQIERGMSVTDVAFAVGYATVSAFSAAFSRHFGAPPSRFTRAAR